MLQVPQRQRRLGGTGFVRAAGHIRRQHDIVERQQRGRDIGLVAEHVEPGAAKALPASASTMAASSITLPRETLTRMPFGPSASMSWRQLRPHHF
jgi:hypothetical protein